MKYTSSAQKTARTTRRISSQEASAGPKGIAIAPPDYGIDVVDREPVEASPEHGWESQSMESTTWPAQDRAISPGFVIQPKLTVCPANDKYEQEADRVVKQLVRMTSSSSAQAIQRQSVDEAPTVEPNVEAAIQRARGGGHSLADKVRVSMEQAFGADFSGVRVHTDTQSDRLNRSLSADAFTTGQDIFFRHGEYNPGSSSGRSLIAHELTHVVQQNSSAVLRDKKAAAPSVEAKESFRIVEAKFNRRDNPPPPMTAPAISTTEQQVAPTDSLIQRSFTYREMAPIYKYDLVGKFLKERDTRFGRTLFTVNDKTIPPSKLEDAINPPTFNIVKDRVGRHILTVDEGATQDVSWQQELLTRPPWERDAVNKEKCMSTLSWGYKGDNPIKGETGDIHLVMKGEPNDGEFANLVKKHEDVHVRDAEETLNKVLKPWDDDIGLLKEEQATIAAATPQKAEKALYKLVGGTPEEISKRIYNEFKRKGNDFHHTPEGQSANVSKVEKLDDETRGETLIAHYSQPPDLIGLSEDYVTR